LSITAAIIWIIGLAFGLFSSFGLLFDLDVEGLCLIFAVLTLASYRTVRKGDEQQIHAQRMVAIIGGPFAGVAGLLLALIPFLGASQDRIIDAGRSVLQFDAFLTVGWTIGFSILDKWLNEFRATRRQLIALDRKGLKEAGEAVRFMAGKPSEAFGELVASITLLIFSGILSVLTVLTANAFLLAGSTALLVAGVGIMLVAWYEIYRSATFLQTARDDMPEIP
jgi:hypothetical protein